MFSYNVLRLRDQGKFYVSLVTRSHTKLTDVAFCLDPEKAVHFTVREELEATRKFLNENNFETVSEER